MALMEAILVYRPHGLGSDESIPLGKTDDPRVLRELRDRLLVEARRRAHVWRNVDPGVFCIKNAEAERLSKILEFALPDEDLGPSLGLVEEVRGDVKGGPAAPQQDPDPDQQDHLGGDLHERSIPTRR